MKQQLQLNLVEDYGLRIWLCFSYNSTVSQTERFPVNAFRGAGTAKIQTWNLNEEKSE
jgi:hypothetical protein